MLFDWILALLPILVILILMLQFRWGAAKAGPAGWICAMLVAGFHFGTGVEILAYAHAKALLLALDVLLITWAAYLLYRVVEEAQAIQVLGKVLPSLTADRGMQALLIGWAFASFLQGVGGFGVPTAITAPILVGLGFTPITAVLVPSLGHAWAVTFGSLASSFQALIATVGLPGSSLAGPAAILLGISGFGCGYAVAHAGDGKGALRRLIFPVLVMGLGMGLAQYLLVRQGLWNIGGFGAGLVGLVIGILLARRYPGERGNAPTEPVRRENLLQSMFGYILLTAIIVLVQFVPTIKAFLGKVVLELPFPEMQTELGFVTQAGAGRQIPIFRHAGALLTYTAILTYLAYWRWGRYRVGAAGRILSGMTRGMMSSSLGIISMVAMAALMAHAGMTDTLARGLAEGVQALFPLVSPWIGALGAFMTGSNTNSNVVFAMLQMRTAELLQLSVPWILAAQTAGGAIGSVLAPTKIIVGAGTVNLGGQEGLILRRLVVYVGGLLLLISFSVWLVLLVGAP